MSKHKRYPWPASALTDPELMRTLHELSKARRKPITQLIREATDRLVADMRAKVDDPAALHGAA